MKFEEVPLAAVAFEDETFRISEDLKILQMSASLLAVGQVCPVVLLEGTESSRFTILCGFRRLHALRSIGSDQVVARLLKAANDDKLLLFLKALWDNLSHRQLIPLEAARTLFVLQTICRVEEDILVQRFLPLLGLSPHRNVLHSHLHLHRLHPELRRLLNAGQISLASAERLAPAAPEIQAQISRLLGSIRLSASLQRQVLDLAEDLAAINYLTMGDFLSRPEIIAVAEDARLTPFQRGEQVYDLLYRQRYPRLTRTREQFQSERANLELPGDIRISGDPFFESPRLHVEFDVTSARAFREAVAALEVSCTKASLDRLFEVS